MCRDPFPGDRVSFLHHIGILEGVRLAADAVRSRLPEFVDWLGGTLADARRIPADAWHDLMQRHVLAELTGEPFLLHDFVEASDLELVALSYMFASGTAKTDRPADYFHRFQERAVQTLLRTDLTEIDVPQAALWLHLGESIVTATADQLVVTASQVSLVLSRFEAAMRRWRWDSDELQNPVRWSVSSEREVQDILWIMLRAAFEDVIDEDALPKVGHSTYRADFALPRLGLLVEAKYVRTITDFKNVEQEVMIDSVAYLKETNRYKEIIVFIYDESSSVEHHDQTRRGLMNVPGIVDVIIVSRPGVLPVPNRGPSRLAHRKKRGT